MTYLVTNRNKKSPTARLAGYMLFFIVIAVILTYVFVPHFFPAVFISLAKPFWRTAFSVESGSLRSPDALLSENEALKREISDDNVRLASVAALQTENDELKGLMGRASTTPYILAAVLERPPFAGYDMLIIDAGTDEGFETGNSVYAAGNVPIGRIADVLPGTSKVMLFSSPTSSYEVLIGSSRVPATAKGRGGGQYEAELPRDMKVSEGDPVIVPSISTKLFGIVSSVISDPADPFVKVMFAPPVSLYSLRWVLVDKNSK